MNKKLLLGILILGLMVIGAACSKAPVAEPVAFEDDFLEEEDEGLGILEGEIVDEDEGQGSGVLIGEIDLDENIIVDIGGTGEVVGENISTRVFNMVAKQFEFAPEIIKVKHGNRVILNITSADVEHGFAIDEYNINKSIPAGGGVVIEFIADKIGAFDFYCSVYCGAGHSSMRGSLIVE
jgi:cytochrome c oxidase subunit 2